MPVLKSLPDNLLANLLEEDQEAIRSQIGKEVTLTSSLYPPLNEIEFTYKGAIHTIWVEDEHLG